MNPRIFFFMPALLISILPLPAQNEPLQPGDLVALCGDSITRRMGYTVMVQDYLLMCATAKNLNTVQFGRGFEKASGFLARLETDVLPFKPAMATICYGMNDGEFIPLKESNVDAYGKALAEAVGRLKKSGVRRIVLSSPGAVDPATYKNPRSTAEEYNATLKALAVEAEKVAGREDLVFIDMHALLKEASQKAKAKYGEDYKMAPDGIHPNPNGHLVMAYAFLKALGCDGEIGKITFDFASGTAECDTAQKIVSCSKGKVEMESTRYPFYLAGKAGDTSALAMAEFIPFTKDLNRYLLVVSNAPAKARVSWGTVSKEFSSEQLTAGINLAEEFPENPFKEPFLKVDHEVKAQQKFESEEFKKLSDAEAKGETTTLDEGGQAVPIREYMLKQDERLRSAASSAVVPVRHVIMIEAL